MVQNQCHTVIWKYFDEATNSVKEYEHVLNEPISEIRPYIEKLFDEESIDADEREHLLKHYDKPLASLGLRDGRILMTFSMPTQKESSPSPQELLSEPESSPTPLSSKKPPPPPPKKKTGVKPPPPPPPKKRVKPSPIQPNIPESPTQPRKNMHRYQIPAYCTDSGKEWRIQVESPDRPMKFEKSEKPQGSGDVEIVFLIDTSGSMSDEMDAVKRTCLDFATEIENTGATVQMSLVGYGIGGGYGSKTGYKKTHPSGDGYTTVSYPLSSPSRFKDLVNSELQISLAGGGGCYFSGPGTNDVLIEAISMFTPSGEKGKSISKNRVIVHISDEYEYEGKNPELQLNIDSANSSNTVVHSMAPDQPGHRNLSEKTGGKFWDINQAKGVADLSGILEDVSSTIAKAISVKPMGKSKQQATGPTCRQYHASPPALVGGAGGRSTSNELSEGEGYVLIDEFSCLYCTCQSYFVCGFCGAHNCRGKESPSSDSEVVAIATCQECNEEVGIVEETEVRSEVGESGGSKKGK